MTSIIYKFTHLPSGKYYIGSLKDSRRFGKYKTSSSKVSRLYSEAPHEWVKEILDSFEDTEFSKVVEIEQRIIQRIVDQDGWGDMLNDCYFFGSSKVFSPGTSAKRLATLRSEDVRTRISNSLKEFYSTRDNPMLGRKHSDETRLRLSVSHLGTPSTKKGVPVSPETLQKMREASTGRKPSEETKAKMSVSSLKAWEKRKCLSFP